MPLTPEDVANKRFTPVRLQQGYAMGEVDQFLDEVEAELGRLLRENEELRGRDAADGDKGESASGPSAAVAAGGERLEVRTAAEASTAAARLLELATRNADELVTEAREEADRILEGARSRAEELERAARQRAEQLESESKQRAEQHESESRQRADKLEADARARAELLDSEVSERRAQLIGDLESERQRLGAEVDDLRAFEREYRSRLREYFQRQLQALDGHEASEGTASESTASEGGSSGGIASLLVDDGASTAQGPREG